MTAIVSTRINRLQALAPRTVSGIDQSGVVIALSNSAVALPADSAGVVSSYALATTTITVLHGGVDQTDNWMITKADGAGVVSTITGHVLTVSSLTADAAQVTITATRSGYATQMRTFNLTRAKAGTNGTNGINGTDGVPGTNGTNGVTTYTWIAYANNSTGTLGFTTGANTGQSYIGIANNKTSATESSTPSDYTWSLIKGADGADGTDGVPGTPGADGKTTYTWFAYANDATGTSGFTTGAWTNQTYLGIATNKLTETESTNPADYSWSLIKGADGTNGTNGTNGATGPAGPRGPVTLAYATTATAWTDALAATALSSSGYGAPIERDLVTLYNTTSGFSETRLRSSGAWTMITAYINGSMVISGTFSADKITTGTLTGVVIRTAASGTRVIINESASNTLRAYSGNDKIVEIGGSTGRVWANAISSASPAIQGVAAGSGAGVYGATTGANSAGVLAETNSSSPALVARSNGTGPAVQAIGDIVPDGYGRSIGLGSNMWTHMYASIFHGNLDGMANTALAVKIGPTSSRPAAANGLLYYDTTLGGLCFANGSVWYKAIGTQI